MQQDLLLRTQKLLATHATGMEISEYQERLKIMLHIFLLDIYTHSVEDELVLIEGSPDYILQALNNDLMY